MVQFLTGHRMKEPLPTTPSKRKRLGSDEEWTQERSAPKRNISPSTMQNILKMHHNKATIKTIKAKYPWYQPNYIEYFERAVQGDSLRSNLARIDKHVFEIVKAARKNFKIVRGWMIRGWAVQYAREICFTTFKGSQYWLSN